MLMYIAVCLAYMVKGLTGFANTLVLTAIMSFERSGRDITPMDLLLSFPANVWMMLQQRRSIQWKKALPVCAVLLAAYMSRTAKDPGEYRANLGFVFVAENVFRLVLYTVTGLITLPVLVEAVKLLPCMVAGFLGGSALSRRMDPERLSRVIMAMLMLSGLALILQNI